VTSETPVISKPYFWDCLWFSAV